jgi:uncharacterized protein (TIRG00374 family)
VGATFLLLLVLQGVVHLLRALAWRLCLHQDAHQLPLRSAVGLWIAGEAVANLSFAWSGEAFWTAATRERIPMERGLSAVVMARVLYAYSSLLLMAASAVLALFLIPARGAAQLPLLAVSLLLVGLCLLPLVGGRRMHESVRSLGATLAAGVSSSPRERLRKFVSALDLDLAALVSRDRKRFARLVALNLLATSAGVLEVYLILRALAVDIDLPTALLIEGASKILAVFSYFVPGNVGTREGGSVLILRFFEMSAALGITLVLVRRARALAWAAIGILLMMVHGFKPFLPAHSPQALDPEGNARPISAVPTPTTRAGRARSLL